MTAFEIVSIFIGILALLIAFGSFVIALLAFLHAKPVDCDSCME